jgi:RHS repeat-associated protein
VVGDRMVQSYSYGYRADGAVERVSDLLRGSVEYSLDALGRATSVRDGSRGESRYTYDALGTVTSSGEASEPWTLAGTQIRDDGRSSYEYDAEGRLICKRRRTLSGKVLSWTYEWNALGQLVRAETPDQGTWTYDYDPLGRRCAKSSVDADGNVLSRTLFTYDGPRLAEEQREQAGGEAATTTWDYEPDSFIPAAQSRRRGTAQLSDAYVDDQFHAIVADLVGTPLELVAADGAVVSLPRHDLWGCAYADTSGEDTCPLRFPGQYFDAETGLHYNLHRYYDPATATYLSNDPLGLLPAPNPRAYIGNPLTESDPLGLNGEGAAGKPIPGANLSNAERVPYGEDPMSKLAITARRSFKNGLTSGKNVAVYLYKDGEGNTKALAIQSDMVHSERLGWKALSENMGIPKEQISSIYTELQPCGPIYHDCDKWLSNNMKDIPVSYSFDYGADKAGQTAGMNALKRALTQVRQGNLPK